MTTTILLTIILFLAGLYFYIKHNYIIQESSYEGMENNDNTDNNDKIKTDGKGCPDILVQEGSKFYLYNSKVVKVPGVNPIVFNNLEDYVEFIEWQRSQNINCPVLFLQQTLDAQGNSVYKIRPSPTNLQGGLPPNTVTSTQTSNPTPNPMSNPIPNPMSNLSNSSAVNFNSGTMGTSTTSVKPNNYLGVPLTSVSSVPTVGDIPAVSIDGIPLPTLPNPTLLIDATQSDRPYNINSYPSYDPSPFYIGRTTPLDVMNYSEEAQPVSPNPMDPNWGGPVYTQKLVNDGYYQANQVKIYVGDDGN
jgi:hypothetical protein